MEQKKNTLTHDYQTKTNRRREIRFPCVGIGLLYSTVLKDCVNNIGQDFLAATMHDCSLSGLAFDIDQALQPGDRLHILISNQERATERLIAEVCWCKPLSENTYRAGVHILAEYGIAVDTCMTESIPILHGPPVPSGVNFLCPSCQQLSTFNYMATQSGDWENGMMPLYNCSNCSTTRTILTILEYNRTQCASKSK